MKKIIISILCVLAMASTFGYFSLESFDNLSNYTINLSNASATFTNFFDYLRCYWDYLRSGFESGDGLKVFNRFFGLCWWLISTPSCLLFCLVNMIKALLGGVASYYSGNELFKMFVGNIFQNGDFKQFLIEIGQNIALGFSDFLNELSSSFGKTIADTIKNIFSF